MKIVVISDTHMPRMAKGIPLQLKKDLETTDLIIHAGDWQEIELYHELCKFAKVEGVAGNVDSNELLDLLGKKRILNINGYKIGVTHGDGKGKTTLNAINTFKYDNVNMIIFGHSHIPLLKDENGIILFNPGSVTDKRRQSSYSYGVLVIDKKINVNHVYFVDKSWE